MVEVAVSPLMRTFTGSKLQARTISPLHLYSYCTGLTWSSPDPQRGAPDGQASGGSAQDPLPHTQTKACPLWSQADQTQPNFISLSLSTVAGGKHWANFAQLHNTNKRWQWTFKKIVKTKNPSRYINQYFIVRHLSTDIGPFGITSVNDPGCQSS